MRDILLAATDQHTNGPVTGVGGIVLVCVVIWLLMGSGPKKK